MTLTKVEGRLVFEFGPSWQVEKYDDHPAYREGIERLKDAVLCNKCGENLELGPHAVDFVGRRNDDLYLIEVKDFRRHHRENRKRLHGGGLAVEVAIKVRDTLAGLVGALHTDRTGRLRPLAVFRHPPKVLLWLEQDPAEAERIRQRADPTLVMRKALREHLSWLTPSVLVVDRQRVSAQLDVNASPIPHGVFELRELMKSQIDRNPPGDVSRDDFRRIMGVAPLIAGVKLGKLCDEGFLARVRGKDDRFTIGPRWDEFHEEPA